MKIVVESRGRGVSQEDLESKSKEVLARLEAQGDPRVVALAQNLLKHTPLSHLISAPVEQVVRWIGTFFDFLEGRRSEVSVRITSLQEGRNRLLLTNSSDAPYLLDSVENALERRQLRFQVISHPILSIERKDGAISRLQGVGAAGALESFILIELEERPEGELVEIEREIGGVIQAVLHVHRDQAALSRQLERLEAMQGTEEYREFWHWLQQGNFIPFSYRCLHLRRGESDRVLVEEEDGSGLGLLPSEIQGQKEQALREFSPAFVKRILRERAVVVEPVEQSSPLLRDEPLIYLGVREKSGDDWREHSFLGLFSQQSLDELAINVPPLHRKIETALQSLCIPGNCHDYRKTIEIFNTFPKVELFFMETEELAETVRSFTLLYRHGSVKVVAARSLAVQGLTLLVIMPREFYAPEAVQRMETYLRRFFRATGITSRIIHMSTEFLSLHVTVSPAEEEVHIDLDRLERGLTRLAQPWEQKLRLILTQSEGSTEGLRLWRKYRDRFSAEYRAMTHPRYALRDIRGIERVLEGGGEIMDLWGPFRRREHLFRLQFYSLKSSYLNELMPLLENLNLCVLEEVDFQVPLEEGRIFIKSFGIRGIAGGQDLAVLRSRLLEALDALRRGEAENDYLNQLLVLTGLSWREIDIFRGYRNYYFQLGSPFTKKRVAFALIHNPEITRLLYRYFEARFRPDPRWENPLNREEEALSPLRMELAQALEEVTDINEDTILRSLFNLIDSTVRTNFFLRRDRPEYFFSFKISALGIIDMPAPRPLFEIYVHSASMEGIHLRGGKVARGGIRWSDRPDDFRTEVLGLMKTQMTKNALIVPVGSKGGFVVKRPWSDREEGAALSKEAYKTLMRGLLDLTDNRAGGQVVRPRGIVAYDEQDPYLVVAADKGTAHLPDTANEMSFEYGFWLGDAFASGGSRGYDHKALGITARGAWECVKRHFRELGKDIQTEPFTVVGIGDMSGDVFGNGMLLSRQTRLRAAFDHRHIFLDPDPDPEISYRERERLFRLPRSSWDDYDRSLISEGGGVFPRSAKDIPLSPGLREWLGVRHASVDAPTLIRLLLAAETDLLWNGGIGTWVKASAEKHEDAGDRANDALRLDASQLRARVVGEGGNLGFTQRGRIEYALKGGRINTDAVDNSAGVDTSDHEVNLKILMQHLMEYGEVTSPQQRDELLAEVTDEVCRAVLANNYGQSLCLSLDQQRCAAEVEPFLDLADRLVNAGLLDRRGEFLPEAKEVLSRQGRTLTRPELAILMSYSKMQIYQALLESDLPEDPGVLICLEEYFPAPIREKFGAHLSSHPLAREITATVMTNRLVDQAGSAFVYLLTRRTGASIVDVVASWLTFDLALEGQQVRQEIFSLDNRLESSRQYQILLELENALMELCLWSLEHGEAMRPDLEQVKDLRRRMEDYQKALGSLLPEDVWAKRAEEVADLEAVGLSAKTARVLSHLPFLSDLLPLSSLARVTGQDLYPVGHTYMEVGQNLAIRENQEAMAAVAVRDRWDRMTRQNLLKRFDDALWQIVRLVWAEDQGNPEAFFARRRRALNNYQKIQEGVRRTPPANFHGFTVMISALEDLIPPASGPSGI